MVLPKDIFKEAPDFFFGNINDMRTVDGDFGEQIEIDLLGIGESAPRKIWFPTSSAQHRRSNWQKWLKAFAEIGLSVKSEKDLVGKYVQFQIVTLAYDIQGRHIEKDFYKPLKLFLDEGACAEAMLEATGELAGTTPAENVASPKASKKSGIPDEIVAQAKAVYENIGKNDATFAAVAASSWPKYDADELLKAVQ